MSVGVSKLKFDFYIVEESNIENQKDVIRIGCHCPPSQLAMCWTISKYTHYHININSFNYCLLSNLVAAIWWSVQHPGAMVVRWYIMQYHNKVDGGYGPTSQKYELHSS